MFLIIKGQTLLRSVRSLACLLSLSLCLKQFMHDRSLPPGLRKKITAYIEYIWSDYNGILVNRVIENELPQKFKVEFKWSVFCSQLRNVLVQL